MSSDHGYTLAEALTALMIVTLAMAGLAQAGHLIGLQARSAERARTHVTDLSRLQRLVATAPADIGPFFSESEGFIGDPRRAIFDCDQRQPCSMTLEGKRLWVGWNGRRVSAATGGAQTQLRYIADDGEIRTDWPGGVAARRLAAVAIVSGEAPVALIRLAPTTSGACLAGRSGCGPRSGSVDVQVP